MDDAFIQLDLQLDPTRPSHKRSCHIMGLCWSQLWCFCSLSLVYHHHWLCETIMDFYMQWLLGILIPQCHATHSALGSLGRAPSSVGGAACDLHNLGGWLSLLFVVPINVEQLAWHHARLMEPTSQQTDWCLMLLMTSYECKPALDHWSIHGQACLYLYSITSNNTILSERTQIANNWDRELLYQEPK